MGKTVYPAPFLHGNSGMMCGVIMHVPNHPRLGRLSLPAWNQLHLVASQATRSEDFPLELCTCRGHRKCVPRGDGETTSRANFATAYHAASDLGHGRALPEVDMYFIDTPAP